MRTTLTLDDDVVAKLEKLRETRRQSFKEIVNEALRRGLSELSAPPKRREAFRTKSVSLGRCLVGDVENIGDALALAEGESFR